MITYLFVYLFDFCQVARGKVSEPLGIFHLIVYACYYLFDYFTWLFIHFIIYLNILSYGLFMLLYICIFYLIIYSFLYLFEYFIILFNHFIIYFNILFDYLFHSWLSDSTTNSNIQVYFIIYLNIA